MVSSQCDHDLRELYASALEVRDTSRKDGDVTWAGFIAKNLLRRKARTALTAAGVAIGVGLIVALLSITAGVKKTANQLIHIGRADFGLFQSGTSDMTRSLLPETLPAEIAKQPGVEYVAAIKLFVTKVGNQTSFLVLGYDPVQFPAKRLVIISGRRAGTNEVLVGDKATRSLHTEVGDSLDISSRSFRVVGIFHSGDPFVDNGAVLSLPVVQKLSGYPHEITTIAITVNPGHPPREVANEITKRFANLQPLVEPGQAVKVDTSSRILISAGWIFSLLALIVGGIGVTNTMAMAVFERTREIGILRAVGWRGRRIAMLIVSEAIGICLLALAVGLAVGVLAAHLFTRYGLIASFVQPDFTPGVFAWGLAFSLGVGLLGAVYPTLRALQLSPIEALRRE